MKLALCLLLLSSSCALAGTNEARQPSAEVLQEIANSYHPAMTWTKSAAQTSFLQCDLREVNLAVQDAIDGTPSKVIVEEYKTSEDAGTRTIILLPPTGGENIIDQDYANQFCRAGFRVALVKDWDHDTDYSPYDLGMHDRGTLREIASIRHVIEYLKETHAGPIGIFGTSVGAISGALDVGFMPEIESAVLIVAGSGMGEIIANSDETHLTQMRNLRLSHFGWTQAEYVQEAKNQVKIDPADFVNFTGPKHIFLVRALNDTTVPTANQRQLAQAFEQSSSAGNLTQLAFPGNHLDVIIGSSFFMGPMAIEFYRESLK